MRNFAILLAAVAVVTPVLVGGSVRASEGELEWETTPIHGVIDVRYIEVPDVETGLVNQTFTVFITSAPPNRTLDVVVKGKHVTTMQTDPFGEATFEMEVRGVTPGADGRPPVNRRIDTGDDCQIFRRSKVVSSKFVRVDTD